MRAIIDGRRRRRRKAERERPLAQFIEFVHGRLGVMGNLTKRDLLWAVVRGFDVYLLVEAFIVQPLKAPRCRVRVAGHFQ
jgi:hypothetical protein